MQKLIQWQTEGRIFCVLEVFVKQLEIHRKIDQRWENCERKVRDSSVDGSAWILGGCHEEEHFKHSEFVFDNVARVCDTDEFGVHDILDDVFKEDEYATKPNDSNAQHDSV